MVRYVSFGSQTQSDVIVEIVFSSCKSPLKCKLLKNGTNGQWWGIYSEDLPTRFVCIKNNRGLKRFATRYGYMDKFDCVNYKSGKFGVVSDIKHYKAAQYDLQVLKSIENVYAPGVPQRAVNSGLCWYSAMCFCCFFCKQMRDLIKTYSKDLRLNMLIDRCLYEPKMAEELRHHLYYKYHLGDDPKQDPEKDGQNGFSEFIILCAYLGIPIVRLFAPNLSEYTEDITDKSGNKLRVKRPQHEGETALLVVRCFRTHWRPKLRIVHNGLRYKLVSVLIGSEHCGHQIGASTCDMRVCRWACADADACREGIGPVFWKVKRNENEYVKTFVQRWWDAWGKMIPVTLFNSESFCDFSPHNRSTCSLESAMKKNKTCTTYNAGVVNSDFVYLREGLHNP